MQFRFGPRDGDFHDGQDLAAPIGTPIVAAADGTVLDAGPASGYGLCACSILTATVTTYGHNHTNHVTAFRAGQPIGEVGNRGQSTSPHLHFQIEQSSRPIDTPPCGVPSGWPGVELVQQCQVFSTTSGRKVFVAVSFSADQWRDPALPELVAVGLVVIGAVGNEHIGFVARALPGSGIDLLEITGANYAEPAMEGVRLNQRTAFGSVLSALR